MSADTEHGARFTLDAALRNPPGGLVAFGLGGPEDGVRRADFAPYFATARAAGLHSAPHAGKSVAPSEIEAAIDRLGVERIGHGIAAATDDPPMFNATLPDEYHRVRDELGCSDETLRQMARRSIEASFAPPELKRRLLSDVAADVAPAPARAN